jgi:putative SOS response-associated peptidase YedK
MISFAGLWDEWKDPATGETLKSCTMIITEPNAMVAEVHDRMPVLIDAEKLFRQPGPPQALGRP